MASLLRALFDGPPNLFGLIGGLARALLSGIADVFGFIGGFVSGSLDARLCLARRAA